MSALRVLYIGGTGIISTACVTESIQQGHDVTILNRGQSSRRDPHPDARLVTGDIRDPDSARSALGDATFDVVCSFVSFTTDHVLTDLELFRGKVGQYVFISSASAYQTPPTHMPVTESTPLRNPYWQYSRDKIACEDLLLKTYRDEAFPMTIVRPSHTYDHTRSSSTVAGRWSTACGAGSRWSSRVTARRCGRSRTSTTSLPASSACWDAMPLSVRPSTSRPTKH